MIYISLTLKEVASLASSVPHHVFCNTVIPLILLPAAISAKLLGMVEGIDCIEIKSKSSPFLLLIQRIPAA